MVTSLNEESLEALIVADMTVDSPSGGWIEGEAHAFNRAHAVDLVQLPAFADATQPDLVEPLGLDEEPPTRRKFIARIQGKIIRFGVVAVLRNGVLLENRFSVTRSCTTARPRLVERLAGWRSPMTVRRYGASAASQRVRDSARRLAREGRV